MNDEALLAVLAEMREIRDEIRALRFAVERGRPRQRIEPDDAALAGLLRAISAAVGDNYFNSSQLAAHAALPDAAALHAALMEVIGAVDSRKIGKLLARIEGREIGGLEVHRLSSKDRNGVIWKVVAAGLRV
jgi:hypothetical protein